MIIKHNLGVVTPIARDRHPSILEVRTTCLTYNAPYVFFCVIDGISGNIYGGYKLYILNLQEVFTCTAGAFRISQA
jgi:hypothetical protein